MAKVKKREGTKVARNGRPVKRAYYPKTKYRDTFEASQYERWATVFIEEGDVIWAFADLHEQQKWSDEQYAKWAKSNPAG